MFQRIGVIGVGLIGGSLGLALKRSDPRIHVLVVGGDPKRLKIAQEMGAVDDWQIESSFVLEPPHPFLRKFA